MFCPSCGNALPENGNFCPKCGRRIVSYGAEAVVQRVAVDANMPQKSKGTLSLTFGIISLALWAFPTYVVLPVSATVVGGILSFLAICFGKPFEKYPNADGARYARVGKILGIIGLILHCLETVLAIISSIVASITAAIASAVFVMFFRMMLFSALTEYFSFLPIFM